MNKKCKILLCVMLIAVIGVIMAACSESDIQNANVESVDVLPQLREADFDGFPIETFDISQITLVVKLKDTVDENGNTVVGDTITTPAQLSMVKAEDQDKLKTVGTKDITLFCYGKEITFSLKLYSETAEKYTVIFYAEDGVTQLGETQRVAEGGRVDQPNVPSKTGYTFIGWTDMDTGRNVTIDNITKSLRLKALYKENNLTVGYYYQEDGEDVLIQEISISSEESGEDYYPEAPNREGYEFVEWVRQNDYKYIAEYEEVKFAIKFVYRKYTEGKYVEGEYDYSGKYADTLSTEVKYVTATDTTITPPSDYLPKNQNSLGLSDANDYRFICWYVKRNDERLEVSFPINVETAYETTYYAYYIDIDVGSEELVYKKSGEGCTISGYNGKGGVVVIPQTTIIDGRRYKVTGIGDGIFKSASVEEFVVSRNNDVFKTIDGTLYSADGAVLYAYPSGASVTQTVVADETEEISPYAFYNAQNLKIVTLNDNLKHIKDYAFRDCFGLESIIITKNVIDIGEGAFRMNGDSNLAEITFVGSEIISLGDEAFYGLNSLKKLELPASLSTLGDGIFYGCSSLEQIDATKNSYFREYNGALYSSDYKTLYAYPAKYTSNANPEIVIHKDCRTVARGAFYYANISCITVVSDVEFETYSVVCPTLKSVRINTASFSLNVSEFSQAFAEYLPKTVYVVNGNVSFSNVSITGTEIRYYDEWLGLGDYYEGYAYSLNESNDGIVINGYNGIYSLLDIPVMIDDLPVVEIADNAFNGNTKITSAIIPISVDKIGAQAFMNCKSLTEITVNASEGVEFSIGARAFYGCEKLSDFNYNDGLDIVSFGEYVFENTLIIQGKEEFVVVCGVLVAYNGTDLTVKVPSSVHYIATDAFKDCGFITEITFETGSQLEIIDEYAFLNCSGIKQITFPSKLKQINDYAFYGCDYLYYVKYPMVQSAINVGAETYYQAGNYYDGGVRYEFADTEKGTIKYYVGMNNTVSEGVAFVEPLVPDIGATDLFIGWYYESDFKTRVEFPISLEAGEELSVYAYVEESTYVSDGLVYSLNEDGTYTVIGYTGQDEHVIIGETYMGASVTGIGKDVFGETVVEITIPNELNSSTTKYVSNVITIGLDAFVKTEWYKNIAGDFVIYDNLLLAYKGNAKIVVIPDDVTILAEGVFKNNNNVEYVQLPKSINIIPAELFSGCTALKEVVMGNEVTQINEKAFYGCSSLEKINFDNTLGITMIAPDALDGTAWLNSQTEDCIVINGILYKYYGNSETLHIPSGITSIAESAFSDNSDLTNLYLPSSLVTIRSNAFENAISLVRVYIPSSNAQLAYIMDNAFRNCNNLSVIDFRNAPNLAEIGESAFEYCMALKTLYVPSDLILLGKNSFRYSGLEKVTVLTDARLSKIGEGAFSNCRLLKTVEFEGNSMLGTIEKNAFEDCTALETFSNPTAPITTIAERAFYNCISLSTVEIDENSITEIGKDAVYRLGYISAQNKNMIMLGNILISYSGTDKIVEIPQNVTLIYDSAFEGNTNVREIVFEEGSKLRKINDRAFFGCSMLSVIDFPSTVETVGYKVVEGTIWYTEQLNTQDYVTINNSLIKYNINYPRQAYIPSEVTKIIKGAFEDSSVYNVKLRENVVEIEDGAFDGIIPVEWEDNGVLMRGWTLTIEGTEPITLGYETAFNNCVSIYLPDVTTYEKFSLNESWNVQKDYLTVIVSHNVRYEIIDGQADAILPENLHALYNAKEVTPYKSISKQYVFVGWFKDADYTQPISYPYILTEDTTIYAKCVDYDVGSNPDKYIVEDLFDREEGKTITNYVDDVDKSVVIITELQGENIYSISGYLGYIPYSGNEYAKFVYNEEEEQFEEYDPYTHTAEVQTYRENTVIEEISFANNCTIEVLGKNCFAGMTNLQKVTLPSSIKRISSEAFADCVNLREIVFADGVQDVVIEEGAFRNCTMLESITIPTGVSNLADKAFGGCTNLREIYLEAEIPINLYEGAMPFEIVASMKIYIPYGKKAQYSSSWMNYYDYLVEMDSVENSLDTEE